VSARRSSSGPTSARHRAREVAFRIAYQATVAGDGYAQAWAQHEGRARLSEDQVQLVDDVVRHLDRHGEEVDAILAQAASHWPLERMSATDRSVLRAAIAELIARPGTPARVVIDEAIELAKRYGSDESGGFVNGVLDRVARDRRPGELQ
jgi:transcription antitermination protein NusB